MTKSTAEVARLFGAGAVLLENVGAEVYPGYPGLVIARATVRSMTWGFPMAMKGKSGQPLKPRPVNNTRADKLDSFFWRFSFEERRCLWTDGPADEARELCVPWRGALAIDQTTDPWTAIARRNG